MIHTINQYPSHANFPFGGTVRHYDESLFTLLEDLKETADANDLKGLAAFQISSPLAVIVIKKDDDTFLEIINPIIVKREGSITPTESTAYFPELTATTKRFDKITLMYEDRAGKQHFLDAEGDLSILIQRKTDYLLGGNFTLRMSKEEKILFDAKLENDTNDISPESCAMTLKSDKLLLTIKYGLILGIIALGLSFFVSDEIVETIKIVENYLMIFLLLLIGIYVFYAQYEGKKYSSCTSCQISNIMGTALIKTIHVTLLFTAGYFIL